MPNTGHILLVDDEPHVLASTAQTLELSGYTVSSFAAAIDALSTIDRNWPGIVISDLRMPRLDGIELMQKIQARDPDIPFILISGHADIADAVKAIQQGAYDFLEKPFHQGRLTECSRRALNHRKLILENRRLSSALDEQGQNIWIGNSLPTQTFRDQLSVASKTLEPLTLQGESGCGKKLAAVAMHKMSMRRGKIRTIDCRVIDEDTNWTEITDSANSGSLVLQHVDRANTSGLRKLSHHLAAEKDITFRLIATSRKTLSLALDGGNLPSSLFYQITRKIIKVPNLRSRAEDIPLLFRHFLDSESRRLGKPAPMFGSSFLAELMTRDWPDNTRELKGICDSWFAQNKSDSEEIKTEESAARQDTPLSLPERVSQFEIQLIKRELEAQSGDIKSTYTALGIPRKTLYDKLSKYAISRENYIAGDLKSSDD